MTEAWKQQQPYAYWLECVRGLGRGTRWELTERAGSPKAVYDMPEEEWREILPEKKRKALGQARAEMNPEEIYLQFCRHPVRYVPNTHPAYPARLKKIPDPPFGIFLWGELPPPGQPAVAVIGARECSEYGRYMAERTAMELAAAGVCVISGMARGIDGISQRAALRAGGKSFAVLGSGADVCYPPENKNLYETLKTRGGILSEYLPGTQPKAGLFPQRNRIISGLADIVLIVEARERSGTLITADMALEQGKEVWVVPGRLTDPLSAGCNRLMKQGAGILTSVEEMLEETGLRPCHTGGSGYIGREPEKTGKAPCREGETFPDMALKGKNAGIFLYLDDYPKSVEQLQRESGMEYRQTVCELMELCVENRAEQVSAGQYVRKHKVDGKL